MRYRERKSWNGFLNHQERIFKQRTRKEVYQLDKLQELLRCEFFTIFISKVNTCDLWFEFNLGLFLQTTRDRESLSWWPLAFYERICGRSWHGIYLVSTWFIELSRLKKVALSYRGWCTLSPLRMYVLMLKLNVFMPKWVRKFYVYIPIGIAVDCMSIILLVLAWVVRPSILLDEGENLTNFILGK